MEWISEHPEPFFLLGMFIISAIGGWIGLEIRKLHARIDKYSEKMDKHIDESTTIQQDLAVLKNIHKVNGYDHQD